MNFNPMVSIIIPVYNGGNYLGEAIESALAQTYKNVEVIVVNDGSNDDGMTDSVAKSFGSKIRYYKKDNGGVASAMNFGIKKMKGEYFSWLSHDDLYYSDKIEVQVEHLSGLDNKEVILFGDFDLINERSEVFGGVEVDKYPIKDLRYGLIASSPIHGCTLLIPRSLFNKVGYFNESLRTTQDYDLWFRMLDYTHFVYLKRKFVKSRIHSEQGTRTMSSSMMKESEDLYGRQIQKTFINSGEKYSRKEIINCAIGLIHKYCFKSALKLMRSLKPISFDRDILSMSLSFWFEYFLYKLFLLRQKLFYK